MSTEQITKDAQIIEFYKGPATFAKLLGLTGPYVTQRVSNWTRRGIPPAVRVKHRAIFDRAERELNKQSA